MDNETIIKLLNDDLVLEHAAIIQYLQHAYAFGEGELACEIEAIAREEMEHFRRLSELIADLGGRPSMDREKVVFDGPQVVSMLGVDIEAEVGAIAQYERHIEQIDNPEVVAVLRQNLADEKYHMAQFHHFQDEVEPTREVRAQPAVTEPNHHTVAVMQQGVDHEYHVVLQYLAHAFDSGICELEDTLEWQAIEEMRHMGWLAEEMEGFGGRAGMELPDVYRPADPADMLRADLQIEKDVTAGYREQIEQIPDEGVRLLFDRIATDEEYHQFQFTKMLEELASPAEAKSPAPAPTPRGPAFTVGSLLGKQQK